MSLSGRVYKFKLRNIIADAPAKAMILRVRGHSGYYSCTKCRVQGERVENTLCFPEASAPPRSSDDYERPENNEGTVDDDVLHDDLEVGVGGGGEAVQPAELDDAHAHFHQEATVLAQIPDLDLVKDIPLDYMHLVCLGVMKRLWYKWFEAGGLFRIVPQPETARGSCQCTP